jgi:hypothetical protein
MPRPYAPPVGRVAVFVRFAGEPLHLVDTRHVIAFILAARLQRLRHADIRFSLGLMFSASRALMQFVMHGGTSMYRNTIRETAARLGRIGTNPRHVEAWMRVEHGTLDWMDPERFSTEVEIALACLDRAGDDRSEALARSFGL